MHPALKVSIVKLPESLRKRAAAATQPRSRLSPDGEDMSALFRDFDRYPTSTRKLLIPILYAALQPPPPLPLTEDEIDGLLQTRASSRTIMCFMQLDAMLKDGLVPAGAVPEIWERVWAWIGLFDALRGIRNLPDFPYDLVLALITTLVGVGQDPTVALVASNEDFWRLVGRVWAQSVENDSPALFDRLASVITLLYPALPSPAATVGIPAIKALDLIADGAQVNYDGLAMIICKAFPRAFDVNGSDEPASQTIQLRIVALTRLFHVHYDHIPLRHAMLRHGMAAGLGDASRVIMRTPADKILPQLYQLVSSAFGLFLRVFTLPPSPEQPTPRYLRDFARKGFLTVLVGYGISTLDECIDEFLLPFLERTFFRFTIYYSVLPELRSGFATVEANELEFNWEPLQDAWIAIRELVDRRLKLVDGYNGARAAGVLLSACDNLECGQIGRRADIKTCSACKAAFYCSSQCQKSDWELAHRNECYALRREREDAIASFGGVPRNLSFLRTLLDDTFHLNFGSILEQLVDCYRTTPTPTAATSAPDVPCTVFDFSSGEPVVSVHPASSLGSVLGDGIVVPERILARVRRSHGRMQLHVLVQVRGREIDERFMIKSAGSAAGAWAERELGVCLFMPLRMNDVGAQLHECLRAYALNEEGSVGYTIEGFWKRFTMGDVVAIH
ncbi:MYND-type domain-containing protein [Mycena kentingensis (nom. inval.)]|nr:MYND-type domain-containing protein [Mycena kentingensis (nom. inval.)]